MYIIQKMSWGYNLVFTGMISTEEMQKWYDESIIALKSIPKEKFGVIVDMTMMKVMQPETKEILEKGQKMYFDAGMLRSAVVLNSTLATMQLRSIAEASGIKKNERYLDGTNTNWPALAKNWVENGVEPK